MLVRAVIRGGRADEKLGLILGHLVGIRQRLHLILLGVAAGEILAHGLREAHDMGFCPQVDAVRLQVVGKIRVRVVGGATPTGASMTASAALSVQANIFLVISLITLEARIKLGITWVQLT